MKTQRIFANIILILIVSASLAYSQRGMGGGGNRGGNPGARFNRYDTSTVVTVSGKITAIDTPATSNRMPMGIRLTLTNDKESIPVQLGPASYLETQSVKLALNDSIDVRGSRIKFDDKPAIIAATIIRGADTLKLRNDNGIPLWARVRRQQSGE